MVNLGHITDLQANESSALKLEEFMLFLADSIEEQGQLVTPLDLAEEIEDSESQNDQQTEDAVQ